MNIMSEHIQPSEYGVAPDLALLGPDGATVTEPQTPHQALDLAERLVRSAFQRMLAEETADFDRRQGYGR